MSDKESYSQMERRLSAMMDRLTMGAFYGYTTSQPQEQEPLTAEKLRKIIRDLPPAPPKIQATPDYLFPQEHYADEVAIIPHHPAHTFFAKMLNPKSPTATVMKSRQLSRPDGTCYQIDGTVYVPASLVAKFEAKLEEGNTDGLR